MGTVLSLFPTDSTPLTVQGNFYLPSNKFQSSCLLLFLHSFSLKLNGCSSIHKGRNALTLADPLQFQISVLHHSISDLHLVSFTITLPTLSKTNTNISHTLITHFLSPLSKPKISPSSIASVKDLCKLHNIFLLHSRWHRYSYPEETHYGIFIHQLLTNITFFLKSLNTFLSLSHRITSKILTGLASKWHFPQRLPFSRSWKS